MVQEYGIFTRSEAAELRRLLHRVRTGLLNPVQRPPTQEFPQNDQIPVAYVARTPEDGITGYTLSDGIPVLNYADCEIWRILDDGTMEEVLNFDKRVWSLYDFDIPGDTFIPIKREAYGKWLAEWLDQGDDLDTGTGTGTGSAECEDVVVYERKLECEWLGTGTCNGTAPGEGELNEYSREIRFNVGEGGCLQRTTGSWTFVRTIACCDPSCACEEDTGTGTPIEQDCCPDNPVPTIINATITSKTGDCVCLPDSATLTWNEVESQWRSNTFDTCGDGGVCYFRLQCNSGNWEMDLASCFNPGILVSESCDPFEVIFDVDNSFQIACTGTFRITFTE